jgi:hypothetical protein
MQIARQFDARDGFDVVDAAEVGLPIFRLTVEAVTLARQELATTQEFILRAIGLGERRVPDIARFLGLPEHAVVDALGLLSYDRSVAKVHTNDDKVANIHDFYEVTELGLERLKNGQRTPQEEVLVFDYDGIRCRPIRLGGESVCRPKELHTRGGIQIRPYPADPPTVSELPLKEVASSVRRISGKGFERTVLAIRQIIRRDNLFRLATGFVFENRTTKELQIGFALGNQLAEDYEIEFARHGGAKKPGLIQSSLSRDSGFILNSFLGPNLLANVADKEESSRLRMSLTDAMRSRELAGAQLERLRQKSKLKETDREDLSEIEERLRQAQDKLDDLTLRPLAPYEQWELFAASLEMAEKRLFITSDTVDADVAQEVILRKINQRLREGVEIRIETSKEISAVPKGVAGSFEPGVDLWLSAQQRINLTLAVRAPETNGLFFLVKDDDLAIVSNKPFLNKRDRPLSFMPTVGVITKNPQIISEIAKMLGISQLGQNNRKNGRRRG